MKRITLVLTTLGTLFTSCILSMELDYREELALAVSQASFLKKAKYKKKQFDSNFHEQEQHLPEFCQSSTSEPRIKKIRSLKNMCIWTRIRSLNTALDDFNNLKSNNIPAELLEEIAQLEAPVKEILSSKFQRTAQSMLFQIAKSDLVHIDPRLFFTVAEKKHYKLILRLALEHGLQDPDNYNCLLVKAAKYGHIDILESVITSGLCTTKVKEKALVVAFKLGNLEAVKVLLEHGYYPLYIRHCVSCLQKIFALQSIDQIYALYSESFFKQLEVESPDLLETIHTYARRDLAERAHALQNAVYIAPSGQMLTNSSIDQIAGYQLNNVGALFDFYANHSFFPQGFQKFWRFLRELMVSHYRPEEKELLFQLQKGTVKPDIVPDIPVERFQLTFGLAGFGFCHQKRHPVGRKIGKSSVKETKFANLIAAIAENDMAKFQKVLDRCENIAPRFLLFAVQYNRSEMLHLLLEKRIHSYEELFTAHALGLVTGRKGCLALLNQKITSIDPVEKATLQNTIKNDALSRVQSLCRAGLWLCLLYETYCAFMYS